MVQATVDNQPVSIVVGDSESTTVPSGEIWKVTIKLFGGSYRASINGTDILNADGNNQSVPIETVLVGGDTVKCKNTSSGEGLHIGGFVVN